MAPHELRLVLATPVPEAATSTTSAATAATAEATGTPQDQPLAAT